MQTSTPTEPRAAFASLAHDAAVAAMGATQQDPPRKRINSQALLGGEREIEIEHSGQFYRLRLTSLGKLILTK